jgi:hypothetical protein
LTNWTTISFLRIILLHGVTWRFYLTDQWKLLGVFFCVFCFRFWSAFTGRFQLSRWFLFHLYALLGLYFGRVMHLKNWNDSQIQSDSGYRPTRRELFKNNTKLATVLTSLLCCVLWDSYLCLRADIHIKWGLLWMLSSEETLWTGIFRQSAITAETCEGPWPPYKFIILINKPFIMHLWQAVFAQKIFYTTCGVQSINWLALRWGPSYIRCRGCIFLFATPCGPALGPS